MSRHAAIPLLAATLGGLALLATGPSREPVAESVPPNVLSPPASLPVQDGAYFSHDWYEPPPRESRRPLIDAGARNPTVTCTLPNCRNCQIHATWKQSL